MKPKTEIELYLIALVFALGTTALQIYKMDRREMVLAKKGIEGEGVVLGEWMYPDSIYCIIYATEIRGQVYVNSDFAYGDVQCSQGDTIRLLYLEKKPEKSMIVLPGSVHVNAAIVGYRHRDNYWYYYSDH